MPSEAPRLIHGSSLPGKRRRHKDLPQHGRAPVFCRTMRTPFVKEHSARTSGLHGICREQRRSGLAEGGTFPSQSTAEAGKTRPPPPFPAQRRPPVRLMPCGNALCPCPACPADRPAEWPFDRADTADRQHAFRGRSTPKQPQVEGERLPPRHVRPCRLRSFEGDDLPRKSPSSPRRDAAPPTFPAFPGEVSGKNILSISSWM